MADFDESLPSHSVFVPHADVSQSKDRLSQVEGEQERSKIEKVKKPFLKKGRYAY